MDSTRSGPRFDPNRQNLTGVDQLWGRRGPNRSRAQFVQSWPQSVIVWADGARIGAIFAQVLSTLARSWPRRPTSVKLRPNIGRTGPNIDQMWGSFCQPRCQTWHMESTPNVGQRRPTFARFRPVRRNDNCRRPHIGVAVNSAVNSGGPSCGHTGAGPISAKRPI